MSAAGDARKRHEPAAPEPSDADAIEALLAAHHLLRSGTTIEGFTPATCRCGEPIPSDWPSRWVTEEAEHRAHLASVLARHVAAAKAEAWDEGAESAVVCDCPLGEFILCGTDNPQPGTRPYYIGYSDLVDGYRHAWTEERRGRKVLRRGRSANHPADPRCPECHPEGDHRA